MKWNPMDECEFIWCRWVRGVFVLWFDWNRVQVTKQQWNMGWKKVGIWCMCVWSHVWVTLRSVQNSAWESKDSSTQWQTQRQKMTLMRTLIYVHCLGLVWEWCPAIFWNAAQLVWSSLPLKSDTCTPSERGSSTPSESHTKYQLSTCKSTDTFFNCFNEWRQASLNKRERSKKKNIKVTLSVLTSTYSNWWGEMMGFKV